MKTAVVTGASRGLGEAIAQALADEGFKVIGTSTSGDSTDAVSEMIALDMSDRGSIAAAAKSIKEAAPDGIDVLYNNAGYLGQRDGIVENPDDAVLVMQVNASGLMDLTAKLLPLMNTDSLIMNMSSGAGDAGSIPHYNMGAYNVSKAAVDMYTRSLARMLEDRAIKVVSTDPQWVATDMGGMGAPKKPDAVGREAVELVNNYDSLKSGAKYEEAKIRKEDA